MNCSRVYKLLLTLVLGAFTTKCFGGIYYDLAVKAFNNKEYTTCIELFESKVEVEMDSIFQALESCNSIYRHPFIPYAESCTAIGNYDKAVAVLTDEKHRVVSEYDPSSYHKLNGYILGKSNWDGLDNIMNELLIRLFEYYCDDSEGFNKSPLINTFVSNTRYTMDELREFAGNYWCRYALAHKHSDEYFTNVIRSANYGNYSALHAAASTFESGLYAYDNDTIKVQVDYPRALLYFKVLASKKNDSLGNVKCGEFYLHGKGVEKDCETAAKYFRKGIELCTDINRNHYIGAAYINLSHCYEYMGDTIVYFNTLKEAYNKGVLEVCHELGQCYMFGRGTKLSYNAAYETFNKGLNCTDLFYVLRCKQQLGTLLENGWGCEQDKDKALHLWEESAAGGNEFANFSIIQFYYKQAEYQKAMDIALKCYMSFQDNKAKGSICSLIAKMYEHGRGVAKNHDEAVKWWTKAARYGNTNSDKVLQWLQ